MPARAVSIMVTTFVETVAVKSACALIAVCSFVALVLLSVTGRQFNAVDGSDAPTASDVKVTVVPSDFFSSTVEPTATFA